MRVKFKLYLRKVFERKNRGSRQALFGFKTDLIIPEVLKPRTVGSTTAKVVANS